MKSVASRDALQTSPSCEVPWQDSVIPPDVDPQSNKHGMKPRLECFNGRQPLSKNPVGVLPWRCRVKGNDRADTLTGKATLTSGVLLGRSEVLRSLRHYLREQSRRHHTIDHLEERGVERGSARRYWRTDIGTVSKATLGKLLTDRVERIRAFPSA